MDLPEYTHTTPVLDGGSVNRNYSHNPTQSQSISHSYHGSSSNATARSIPVNNQLLINEKKLPCPNNPQNFPQHNPYLASTNNGYLFNLQTTDHPTKKRGSGEDKHSFAYTASPRHLFDNQESGLPSYPGVPVPAASAIQVPITITQPPLAASATPSPHPTHPINPQIYPPPQQQHQRQVTSNPDKKLLIETSKPDKRKTLVIVIAAVTCILVVLSGVGVGVGVALSKKASASVNSNTGNGGSLSGSASVVPITGVPLPSGGSGGGGGMGTGVPGQPVGGGAGGNGTTEISSGSATSAGGSTTSSQTDPNNPSPGTGTATGPTTATAPTTTTVPGGGGGTGQSPTAPPPQPPTPTPITKPAGNPTISGKLQLITKGSCLNPDSMMVGDCANAPSFDSYEGSGLSILRSDGYYCLTTHTAGASPPFALSMTPCQDPSNVNTGDQKFSAPYDQEFPGYSIEAAGTMYCLTGSASGAVTLTTCFGHTWVYWDFVK